MHLDFLHPHRRDRSLGWGLLAVGLAALAAVLVWRYSVVEPQRQQGEAQLRQLQARLTELEPQAVHLSDQQLAADWATAVKVNHELSAPWEGLFGVLEGAAQQPIALLSLEPDSARRELVLGGEARNYEALMEYYRYLQRQPLLTRVSLQTHQVSRQDRDKPIRFRISAHWERSP